ncbi:hypothetical protein AB0P15_28225 [Streptomyces sp. NPDC087917]|uniref:hypothetical protein n=1 Tax=Streptomyces sp. NPDC087917 TaxID=3155060 RepID=UPI0034357806
MKLEGYGFDATSWINFADGLAWTPWDTGQPRHRAPDQGMLLKQSSGYSAGLQAVSESQEHRYILAPTGHAAGDVWTPSD